MAKSKRSFIGRVVRIGLCLGVIAGITLFVLDRVSGPRAKEAPKPVVDYRPQTRIDSSGFPSIIKLLPPWDRTATLKSISDTVHGTADRGIQDVERNLTRTDIPDPMHASMLVQKAFLLNSKGRPDLAYDEFAKARGFVERNETFAKDSLYQLIYFQAIAALRRGENDNCIDCRGESSCILPISGSAIHTFPKGSRLAIQHFTNYLEQFPQDIEAKWLLNVAHMTLGEYPQKVEPKYVLSLDRFNSQEFNIGKFRDVGHLLGVNRLNQAGGAVMEDFDNDGRLDLMTTSWDPAVSMVYYHNKGDGTFEDRSIASGVEKQIGGLVCYQTDYNNDGFMDVHIPRGAWYPFPMPPSLLRNNGNGTFTDVTKEAGLYDPVNSNAACWADYDNDGWLDVFVACERQTNRLYRNKGNGTFEEVAERAGVAGDEKFFAKGANWIDYDNDDYPDLFVNNLQDRARLFHNDRNGRFTEVTLDMKIFGPARGFSCWAFDYDNDGWLDIYAACYDRNLGEVVKGLIGEPATMQPGQLLHNVRGEKFEDVTEAAGLNLVIAAMGTNFADLDNDGFLDFYCGTGEPDIATLIPNRMFKNIDGKRFSEITSSSGTGHLQKGHEVACGDWDRDGDVDVFIEMGGTTDGDRYHDIMFLNPGQGNNWLGVKLVGKKSNRAAIGARIKVVTAGKASQKIYRHVTSGSSFGANALEQIVGLGKATKIESLEIHWPTSGTTQVLHDIDANQMIEITEFAPNYRKLETKPIPLPAE